MIITDPTSLIDGGDSGTSFLAPLSISTANKTITITPGSGCLPLSTDGVTFQALYSACKLLWKNSSTYIKYPFPFESITPEQYEIKNGWAFADATTRKAIRTAGWVERLTTDNTKTTAIYSGIISLGSLTGQPYYQQASGGSVSNFTFSGAVNEAVQVLSDPNGDGSYADGYDRRSYFKLFVREEQKTYSSSELSDIGVTTMTSIVYRFSLSNGSDSKVTHTDVQLLADSDYDNINITYYETNQNRSIGGVNYPFRVIIAGDSKTAEQIYEKVQYLLRLNSDIDAGAGTVIGKSATPLLSFVGDTLITGTGVYIDSYSGDDTNRLKFTDQNGVERVYPYTASGFLLFNDHLVNDSSAKYWMFFTTNPTGNYGSSSAVLVQDSSSSNITGTVTGNSIAWTFSYDSNTQGGRTAATDADVTVVAIGLETGQFVSTTATIKRSTGQNIALTAALERNYVNA